MLNRENYWRKKLLEYRFIELDAQKILIRQSNEYHVDIPIPQIVSFHQISQYPLWSSLVRNKYLLVCWGRSYIVSAALIILDLIIMGDITILNYYNILHFIEFIITSLNKLKC